MSKLDKLEERNAIIEHPKEKVPMEINGTELLGPSEIVEEDKQDDLEETSGKYSDILHFEFQDHPEEDG